MTSILDKFSAASASFQPATSQDFFALRLAQKLDDTSHVPQYVALVAAHRPELLLVAYQHAADASPSARAVRFHSELKRLTNRREDAKREDGSDQD